MSPHGWLTRCFQPGYIPLNASFCMPCPAGWACSSQQLLGPCATGFWSPQGVSVCVPCSAACDPARSIALQACRPVHDSVCHICPRGFRPINGTCRAPGPDTVTIDAFGVANFLVLVLEILILVSCYRCMRAAPPPPRYAGIETAFEC